jgi:hypothetical protein
VDSVGAEGTLGINGGCIALQIRVNGELRTAFGLLWPEGVTVNPSSNDGQWDVMTSDGEVAAVTGARVSLGGTLLNSDGAQRVAIEVIPPTCMVKRYFAIANIEQP